MRWAVCVAVVVTGLLVRTDAEACSPPIPVPTVMTPLDGTQDVPTNARVVLRNTVYGIASDGGVSLAVVESDGGLTAVASDVEVLRWRKSGNVTLHLEASGGLLPDTQYAVRSQWGWGDQGLTQDGVTLSTFHTGMVADDAAPGAPAGFEFDVLPSLRPPDTCQPGANPGPFYDVDAVFPDAGLDVTWYASVGNEVLFAGVGSAKLRGAASCGFYRPPEFGFALDRGPSTVTVWTEDVAGNASPSVTIATDVDCTEAYDAGAYNAAPSDAGPAVDAGTNDPSGCASVGSRPTALLAFIAIAGLALLAGLAGSRRRQEIG